MAVCVESRAEALTRRHRLGPEQGNSQDIRAEREGLDETANVIW